MGPNGSFYHLNGMGFRKEINIVILSNADLLTWTAFPGTNGKTLLGSEAKGNSPNH
jgi:hypothetical protein